VKFAKAPLLYIQQPTVNKPSAPMQHTYSSPKKKTRIDSNPEPEKKNPQQPIKKYSNFAAISKEIVQDLKEAPKDEKPTKTIKRTGKMELTTPSSPESTHVSEITSPSQSTPSSPTEQQANKDKTEKKKFKDMSIMEKIMYFINTPNHLPRMRCVVITDERKYRGIIKDFQDDHILMQVGRLVSTTKINIEDVREIQLLGLG
jgi:hypothetical protein